MLLSTFTSLQFRGKYLTFYSTSYFLKTCDHQEEIVIKVKISTSTNCNSKMLLTVHMNAFICTRSSCAFYTFEVFLQCNTTTFTQVKDLITSPTTSVNSERTFVVNYGSKAVKYIPVYLSFHSVWCLLSSFM